ncbi:hypothetical protein ZWY2020_049976 [Hordeum vulgare]|nr:hypothetical protein ZWY2020_049976 [Hordeum vulgare]
MPDESFMSEVAKKLPLLRQLVLSGGLLERDSLAALVDRWPRLRLLHARVCHTTRPIGKTLRRRLEKRIKHLRLPHRHSWIDAMSVHDSNQSSVTNLNIRMISFNEVENASTIIDWFTLVIEPEIDGKNSEDEKLVDEKAMFALFGLEIEADERDARAKATAMFTPILHYDAHEVKVAAMLVDDKALEEPLILWDE